MVKLTMALLQWTQSVETLVLHYLNIPTTHIYLDLWIMSLYASGMLDTQLMSLHGLSSKYGDIPLTLQCLQVFFTKLWEIDRCHQTQWCKWHLWTFHYKL